MSLITIVSLALMLSSAQSAATDEILRLERLWVEGLLSSRRAVFEEILDESLTQVGPRGETGGKRTFLEFFSSGDWDYVTAELQDPVVRVFGDTAVVTARLRREIKLGAVVDRGTLAFTHVWVRRGTSWRAVHAHTSSVPDK